MVAVGDLTKASKLFRKNLVYAIAIKDLEEKLDFYHAGKLLFKKWQLSGRGPIRAQFPKSFPLFQAKPYYSAADLAIWFAEQEQQLVEQFNTRNGNRVWSERLATDDCWLLKDYGGEE